MFKKGCIRNFLDCGEDDLQCVCVWGGGNDAVAAVCLLCDSAYFVLKLCRTFACDAFFLFCFYWVHGNTRGNFRWRFRGAFMSSVASSVVVVLVIPGGLMGNFSHLMRA